MVKRYTPCLAYDDAYDDYGYPTCKEAAGGTYVKYATYRNEMNRMQAQVNRQKTHVRSLEQKLKASRVTTGPTNNTTHERLTEIGYYLCN